MKAFLCKEFGPIESHQVEEIDDPVAGPGEAVSYTHLTLPTTSPV